MKLPKSLTTVTLFSKLLALSMLIFFPIVGFYLGMLYQSQQDQQILKNPPITVYPKITIPSPTPKAIEGKMCTMEAKLCPDGSYVGRSGPNCAFAPCPKLPVTPTPTCVPRPACLDETPRCMIAETKDMCPKK